MAEHETDPQALAEACAAAMWRTDPASQALGMQIERIAPGEATLSMTATEVMGNGHGTLHGGYIFTLADSAFAFACNTYDVRTVAQHCSVSFLRPGIVGERLTATAREVARTGRTGIYDIRVARSDGTVVAEFRGHSRSLGQPILEEDDTMTGSPT
ncbi:hydroxyphenylacetyl-CoA thioesterase PaaI [Roseicyclus sp. F158]|uniref:Hydroxyphenylacetyl-CoA thioesterase PaaI n=1 Tax=Tropicimonas omnivorans TaxID=3075590 RepID=A0ABU3DEU6_9RHOB|nr:hydroxyphenylacetyl-CoA thioesterase PaaI [Roseicyclus sp. F158]MDT0682202.1 hydroxyphenylacetyl-CoA thioesterase PaaI [Roseicyclus sp. F158]